MIGTKQCNTCKKVLPYEQYHKRGGGEVGYRSKCKGCYTADNGARRRANLDAYNEWAKEWRRTNKRSRLSSSLRYRFGIGIEDYEKMLNDQQGMCAICNTVPEHSLNVDHDHHTLKIRGLLCGACNRMLGQAGDRVEVLQKAIEYLEIHRAN